MDKSCPKMPPKIAPKFDPKYEKSLNIPALISAVKTHREIWDFTHIHYNNNQVLLDTWDQLGQLFNLSGNDIRTKWKSLRDTYKKCYTNHRETGQPIKWSYFNSLRFLDMAYPGKRVKKIAIKEEPFDKAEIKITSTQSLNCTVDGLYNPKIEDPFQYRESEKDDTILEYPFDESVHIEKDLSPERSVHTDALNQNSIFLNPPVQNIIENYFQPESPVHIDTLNHNCFIFNSPVQNHIENDFQPESPVRINTFNHNSIHINPPTQNFDTPNDFPLEIKTEPIEMEVNEMVETVIPDEMHPENTENEKIQGVKPDEEELKAFLLELLPQVEPMDRKQMRIFKKEVSNLVKTILDK